MTINSDDDDEPGSSSTAPPAANNLTLRPSRTISSTTRRRGRAPPATLSTSHDALKSSYAIPTPLHSPHASPQRLARATTRSTTTAGGDLVLRHGKEHDDDDDGEHDERIHGPLDWRGRLRHFTWTWFCMTMATGQIANVLEQMPYRFHGLYAIGVIVVLFNITLFVINTVLISSRFYLYPKTFWNSLTHPTESLFVPAAVISIGTILLNITQYGIDAPGVGPWLQHVMIVMFWIYCGLAMCTACGIYLIMWSTQAFTLASMTPVWIFPAYPLLVVAPHASILASRVTDHDRALEILIGGFTLQGIGFMLSTMIYAAFLYRLMTNKLPDESLRPGMFISVGPSGFTISGVIGMGAQIRRVIPADFMQIGELAGVITMIAANWMGIWLWGLALFFFIVSIGANIESIGSKEMCFALTWYSFIFPNTGLTTATFSVGQVLNNEPIKIVGCVFTVLLIIAWIIIFSLTIRAVYLKQVLWPQRQEDRDETTWMFSRQRKGSMVMQPDVEDELEEDLGIDTRVHPGHHSGPDLQLTRASMEEPGNTTASSETRTGDNADPYA